MPLIEHSKIASLTPVWAGLHGFSLLFDNPGPCLIPQPSGMQLLHNEPLTAPGHRFFRLLVEQLEGLGLPHLMNAYGFCPLPPPSYHVTVWDGLSQLRLPEMEPSMQSRMGSFLQQLPDSLASRQAFMEEVKPGALLARDAWEISFVFSHLSSRNGGGLAAVLRPANDASAHLLQQLRTGRQRLSRAFSQSLQFHHDPDEYITHVTLGYFLNRELSGRLSAHVELAHWSRQFEKALEGCTLTFTSVGLYAYTSMAHFFRLSAIKSV